MSQKLETKKVDLQSINGSFSFKGEHLYGIAEEFFKWCEIIEEKFDVTLTSNRADYNNYIPIDKNSVEVPGTK